MDVGKKEQLCRRTKGMDHWAKARAAVAPPGPSFHTVDSNLSLMRTKMLSCKEELVVTHNVQ